MNVSNSFGGPSAWGGSQAMAMTSRRMGGGQQGQSMAQVMQAQQGLDQGMSAQGIGMQGRGGPPPGPPPGFELQRSTSDFASSRSADPIAALDSDGDGAVSSTEFGLDGASSEVQQFFAAIDSDADGSLSASELDTMRSQMQQALSQQAMGGSGGPGGMGAMMGPPPPPPPPSGDAGQDSASAQDSESSAQAIDDGSLSAKQLAQMLQRLSQEYLRLMAEDGSGASLSTTSTTLSVSA